MELFVSLPESRFKPFDSSGLLESQTSRILGFYEDLKSGVQWIGYLQQIVQSRALLGLATPAATLRTSFLIEESAMSLNYLTCASAILIAISRYSPDANPCPYLPSTTHSMFIATPTRSPAPITSYTPRV